jgi:hypothetical protein
VGGSGRFRDLTPMGTKSPKGPLRVFVPHFGKKRPCVENDASRLRVVAFLREGSASHDRAFWREVWCGLRID